METDSFINNKLGNICHIIMGQSPKGDTYNDSGVGLPLLNGPTEFGPTFPLPKIWTESPTKTCKPGDLLFCVRGSTTGKMNWADQEYCLGRGVAAFRSKLQTRDTRFIYYALVATLDRLLSLSTGSVFPNLSRDDFLNFEIPWPDDKERIAIAAVLGALDDKIELNRQMNQTLEAIAQAIFKSWFVDFDPVKAKAEAREPAGLAPEVAALFPDSFADSELGEIPEMWRIEPLDEVADYLNGLALQKYPPSGHESLPVIKIAELRKGNTDGADRASAALDPKYVVADGDVLFSWSGSLEVCIWCGGRGALNQHLFKVTSQCYPKWFYYLWTRTYLPEFQKIASDKATTMGHIQRHHLSESLTLIPSNELLVEMNNVIDPIFGLIINNRLESRTLAEIRDVLLPKLLSGEVRIKDAEKFVEAHL